MKKQIFKESALFIILTFSLTWLVWIVGNFYSASNSIMLGTFVPSILGLIFSVLYKKKLEFKLLLRSAFRFKAPYRWWLYAILLFPAILLCSCIILVVIKDKLPEAHFSIWFLPFAFFYIFVCMGPLGEEFGWRGFLLKRFLSEWNIVKSGLVLGLIWSVWHIPLFLIQGTIQYELAKIGLGIAIIGYFLYTICISLLIAVLYYNTDGNLLLCMIFHTVCNMSLGVVPIILTKRGATVLLIILIIVTFFISNVAINKKSKISSLEQ